MKTALVIGSTGLVGSHLVKQLCESEYYSKVILLNRRTSDYKHPKLEEKIINFEKPDLTGILAEDVFCAIGTTIKKAGSKEAQFKIDCEYPAHLASVLKTQGTKQFVLVSSIGANSASSNFYLNTKGQLEDKLKALHFDSCIILRPSFIMGERKEFRLGEKVALVVLKLITPLMFGGLKKYRGVQASDIAAKMISSANLSRIGFQIIESGEIVKV